MGKNKHKISNDTKFSNGGLAEAIGYGGIQGAAHGFYPGMIDGGGGVGFGRAQISQSDTLFRNLRNYLISNFRQLLSQCYVEIGLIKTMVNVPIDDALKGGIVIKSKQLNEEDIKKLDIALERNNDIQTVAQAAKWKRLFGGSGVIILTDQDPETALDIKSITKDSYLEFRAVDMWELYWSHAHLDDSHESLENIVDDGLSCYDYYNHKLNRSRVIKMKGMEPPSYVRQRLRGWGLSVLEVLVRPLNQYLKATDLTFEVLDEFKLDIYKIKGLTNTLASGPVGTRAIQERVAMANWQKNYQNGLSMDSEDDFQSKQLSFTGLSEVMSENRMQVASDLRMPITKIFGISAQGFNSGEDDIEVYNSMIESEIRTPMKYDILRVIEIRCQKEFGFIPDDLSVEFKPLRILSAEQEENVKTQKFNRLLQAKQANEITTIEFRDAINRGNLFDIQLDTTDADLLGENADTLDQPDPIENPGSDSEDTEKEEREEPRLKIANEYDASITTGSSIISRPVKQKLFVMPSAWQSHHHKKRMKNSIGFDRAAYEADGGDAWIDEGRLGFFSRDQAKDNALWLQAVEESAEIYGGLKKPFVVWLYKKLGGSFD